MNKPKPLLIGVDIDGICADLHTPWINWYNDRWYDTLTLADLTVWGMHQIVKPECGQHIYDFLNDATLYEHIEPHAGAAAAVAELQRAGHDVVAITWSYAEDSLPGKIRWIQRHLNLGRSNIITGERKELLSLDVLIDDAPHNLRRYRGRWPLALVLGIAWPYNAVARCYTDLLAEDYRDTASAWAQLVARIHKHAAPRCGCNRHIDCAQKRPDDVCCHVPNCEDCFGK